MKSIFKEGSLYPVPVMEKPVFTSDDDIFFQGDCLDHRTKSGRYTAYLSTVIPVPSEHQSHFVEGREYEEGKDFNIEYQLDNGNGWLSGPKENYDNYEDRFGSKRIVAIPISKKEEVEERWKELLSGPPIDYTNFEQLAKDCWLFLTNDKMPEKATIKKAAFIHEVKVMIETAVLFNQSLTPLSQNTPSTGDKR